MAYRDVPEFSDGYMKDERVTRWALDEPARPPCQNPDRPPAPKAVTLTLDEIRRRYRREWVLLDQVEATDFPEVLAGRVLWHSPDRDEVHRKAMEMRPGRAAILFMGLVTGEIAVNR